jgi:hypothetical protein
VAEKLHHTSRIMLWVYHIIASLFEQCSYDSSNLYFQGLKAGLGGCATGISVSVGAQERADLCN